LYIIACNYSAAVAIYIVTHLTAQSMDNFKVGECPQSMTLLEH